MTTEEILERIDAHEDPNLMETLDLKSRGVWECSLQLSIIASKLPDPDAGSLAEPNVRIERAIQILNTVSEGKSRLGSVQDAVTRAVHVLRNGTELD